MERLQIVRAFCDYIRDKRYLSPHTVHNYGRDLDGFADFAIQFSHSANPTIIHKTIVDADADFVKTFIKFLEEKELAPATIARKVACLRTFYKWCEGTELVRTNPMKKVVTVRPYIRSINIISAPEIARLINSPDQNKVSGLRDRAIIELLYSAALSISELTRLNIDDIELPDGECGARINVRSPRKESRLLVLNDSATKTLREFINQVRKVSSAVSPQSYLHKIWDGNKPLFFNKQGERINLRNVRRKITKYVAIAELGSNVTPHTLRHSRAVHLLQDGKTPKEVKDFLGHGSSVGVNRYRGEIQQRLHAAT